MYRIAASILSANFARLGEQVAAAVGGLVGDEAMLADEHLLREIFSETNIAHYPRKSCYQLRGFDSPDCIDRAMGVGGRHDLQSHQLRALLQGPKHRRYALAAAFPRGF